MSKQSEYGLIVPFPDQSPSFVHGYEAGMIWEAMSRGDVIIERTVHAENIPVLRSMADVKGYNVEIADTEFMEWNHARFTAAGGGGGKAIKMADEKPSFPTIRIVPIELPAD